MFKLFESVPERMIPCFEAFLPQPIYDRMSYFYNKLNEKIEAYNKVIIIKIKRNYY